MGEVYTLGNPRESSQNGSNTDGSPDYANLLVPDGTILRAAVVKIETQTKQYKDDAGNPIVRVSFRFRVTEDGPFRGKNIWGDTSTSFVDHPNCKLRSWVGELLGVVDLPEGFSFNTDDFVDAECQILVENYPLKTKPGERRNRVTEVMRARSLAPVTSITSAATLGGSVVEEDFGEEPF